MTKGIIQTEFDGALVRTTEIEESDVVFVVAAKRGGESLTDSDWTVQNIARIDGANRKELIELLVGFIKEILTNICDGKPMESAGAMRLFLRRLDSQTNKYALEHFHEIMAEKEDEKHVR